MHCLTKKVVIMKSLSIETTYKVQGGGFYSYFYKLGYEDKMQEGTCNIKFKPVYVGSTEALVVFHEKLRELEQNDALHNKQVMLLNAQIACINEKNQYYKTLEAAQTNGQREKEDI